MNTLETVLAAIEREQIWAKHTITRKRFGLWYATGPDNNNMSFSVAYLGQALVIFGDVGELIFLPWDDNAFRWAVNARFKTSDMYYPMSKVSRQMRAQEFVPAEATTYLKEELAECEHEDQKQFKDALKVWAAHPDEQHLAEAYWYEVCGDAEIDDPPDCRAWTSRTVWVYQALAWFLGQVSWLDPRFKEELNDNPKDKTL